MTRHEAKEKALEIWGELGVVARAGALLGLLASMWLLVTAAKGATENWLLPRAVHTRYVDSIAASAVLHEVRDSARQEKIQQQLRYLICREDFSRQQCLRPDR
jgi:hypothetical protein